MDAYDERIKFYYQLLNGTYTEAVESLRKKYGEAKDDFFRENSYNKFLNHEIKKITKGKYSRTSDGLYCHHVGEINNLNLNNEDYIFTNRYPFKLQTKKKLIYCDLIEHLILHTLISKETNRKFGYPGYRVFLYPQVVSWYVDKQIPKPKWMQDCYETSFLEKKDAQKILDKTEEVIFQASKKEK